MLRPEQDIARLYVLHDRLIIEVQKLLTKVAELEKQVAILMKGGVE